MTSSAAKKKVKSHVTRYKNEKGFRPTRRRILYWFRVINRAAFKGKLTAPDFKIYKLDEAWGWCIAGKKDAVIKINADISSRELFIETLAHEMVHLHQYYFEGGIMNHKESFKVWKRFFKRHMKISI